VAEVERVAAGALDAAGLDARDTPLLIEGGAAGMPACARWSAEYLGARLGRVVVAHKLSQSHRHPDFHAATLGEMFARETRPLGELIELCTSGAAAERARRLFTGDERFLLQRRGGVTRVDPELAPLLEDAPVPALVPAERLYTVWAWLSGTGVRTWLHYDNNGCHNLNAQITGEKSCALYPPETLAAARLFPPGGRNPAVNCSSLDVEDPDLPEDFRAAEHHDAHLGAGDLLFIPAWWLHTFRHHGDFNSNVNYWWKPERARDNPIARRQAEIDATRLS